MVARPIFRPTPPRVSSRATSPKTTARSLQSKGGWMYTTPTAAAAAVVLATTANTCHGRPAPADPLATSGAARAEAPTRGRPFALSELGAATAPLGTDRLLMIQRTRDCRP